MEILLQNPIVLIWLNRSLLPKVPKDLNLIPPSDAIITKYTNYIQCLVLVSDVGLYMVIQPLYKYMFILCIRGRPFDIGAGGAWVFMSELRIWYAPRQIVIFLIICFPFTSHQKEYLFSIKIKINILYFGYIKWSALKWLITFLSFRPYPAW